MVVTGISGSEALALSGGVCYRYAARRVAGLRRTALGLAHGGAPAEARTGVANSWIR